MRFKPMFNLINEDNRTPRELGALKCERDQSLRSQPRICQWNLLLMESQPCSSTHCAGV